jgi:hypothetical protein
LGEISSRETELVKAQMQQMLDELRVDSARGHDQQASLLDVFSDLKKQVAANTEFEMQMVDKLGWRL